MAGKKSVIETGVDKLVNLVREQKRVSVKQAAKDLGVSMSSVEEWAEFLEEAGLITVQTKLATVYLLERDINEKEILAKLRDVQDEKESFMRRVESSVNALQSDNDEIKLIDSEFRKIHSALEKNIDTLQNKLDKLEDFRKSRGEIGVKEKEIEKDYEKRLSDLDAVLKKKKDEFSKVMGEIGSEIGRVKAGHERLETLKKAQNDLGTRAREILKLLGKVELEITSETDKISAEEARLEKAQDMAEKLKGDIESDAGELKKISSDMQKARKEFESMEKDFRKEIELLGQGKIEKLEAYKDSRRMLDRFRKFLSSTREVEDLIRSTQKEEEKLRKHFETLMKKAQMFHVVSSSPKLKKELAGLENELSSVQSEKKTLSDKLRKLRLIMRSVAKK